MIRLNNSAKKFPKELKEGSKFLKEYLQFLKKIFRESNFYE